MKSSDGQKGVFRRMISVLLALAVICAFSLIGTVVTEASQYCYFKKPTANKTYKAGAKVPVEMYAGWVNKETKMDAWGNPETVIYHEMPAVLKVFKGKTEIYSREYTYKEATTISAVYVPKVTGTLTLKYFAKTGGLNDETLYSQDSVTIKVSKIKPAEVAKARPAITVTRAAKNKAVINCDSNYGYGVKVYRATKKNGKYTLVRTLKANQNKFTDSKLAASKVYYYKARIFAKSGKKTYASKTSAAVKAGKFNPSSDTSALHVIVAKSGSGVKISWDKQEKAGYYLVTREAADDPEDSETWCMGDNELSYTDTSAVKGRTYKYFVSAWYGDDTMPLVKSKMIKFKVQ